MQKLFISIRCAGRAVPVAGLVLSLLLALFVVNQAQSADAKPKAAEKDYRACRAFDSFARKVPEGISGAVRRADAL